MENLSNPTGKPIYKNLSEFIKFLMVLPHSSASADWQFSRLKVMKTVLRNKLKPEISFLMYVHRFIPNVALWEIPKEVLEGAKNCRYEESKSL